MSRQDIRKSLFALAAGVVMIYTALTACAAPTAQPLAEPTNPPASPGVEAPQEVQRVTLEESKAAFDSNAALFLDVRTADSYAASHIPGALSIPLEELETRVTELDPDQWIISYCT